ncbi:MAG: CusA/CzcA family heavy metal efflux RND transporter [Polaromonas sp.]|nr:CusA/CzcA family heavy metal efflux RND transporter [Polaromonas sp.]
MLNKIIDWSGRNVFLVLLATLFVTLGGIYAVVKTPIDALPDLSDVQVIVYTEYPGQAPQVVEDQVTYPLTTAMLSVPKSRVVRGFSYFGASFVYIIFEDGTDIYWARSRVLEYLNFASGRMPKGVAPQIGPDATGVGWVYQYVVLAKDKTLAELRTLQDWYLRYQLTKAHGVAEVASIGGFVQTYQVTVDPVKLRAYGIALNKVVQVIRESNRDVGGRVVEMAETEYMVRGKGYLRGKGDIESLVVKSEKGTPVLVRDIARVELAPDERRGLTELNGEGEVVSGIAMARYGQNALDVIHNIKAKIGEISAGLPAGVSIEAVYDRADLIHRAIKSLTVTLIEESIIVALVCFVFLLHARSALVAILMLPVAILMAFIAMRLLGMSSNLMSLGGIAIAIGAMIDAAIVMIENAHKHLERLKQGHSKQQRVEAILDACKEVGPALFFSLLIITVSFLPVFTLESQEGRLFSPLAYTKTFAMASAALLSLTLVPVLMILFIRGKIMPEAKNPVNRFLIWVYRPIIEGVMRWKKLTIVAALIALAVSFYPASKLGSEFMPTLNEGTLLFMPSSLPGMSITKAAELMQTQNKIIKSFPEVASVWGKAGRANTATDPAPTEMFETVINLKPESEWRPGMSTDRLIGEMDQALQFPGVSNAWTMPIKARLDMLATGIRTPIGIKVFGKDLGEMEKLAKRIEAVVKQVPGTTSAFAERITGGFYLNIEPDRAQLARYGLSVGEVQDVIGTALGGEMVTTTVEGRERFGVTVRYPRELRSDPEQISREVLVPTTDGAMIPLGQLARIEVAKGTPGIRTENALLSAYIYVDIRDRDIGGYVADARKAVNEQVKFPPGYYATWSGQFEYMERAIKKMKIVVPVTLLLIFLLLYLNFQRLTETLIVMLSVPFAVVAIMAGLLPIMWGTGTGSEVMSRIAAPMVGGMVSSTVLTLAVIPALYALVKQWRLNKGLEC